MLKKYLKEFLTCLQDSMENGKSKYFWELDKQTIVNRISTLKIIKVAYEYY